METALAHRVDGVVATIETDWTPEALSLAIAREGKLRDLVIAYYKGQMQDGHHFYRLPGQEERKPALSKEGAYNLCSLFKVVPYPDPPEERFSPDGHYSVKYRVKLINRAGEVVAIGDGSCSTRESRYAYRQASRKCPECEKEAIIRGKAEYGGGWLCFKKRDGCGAKFQDGEPLIETQIVGRVPNEDLADQENTVLKMADKRATVNATLKLPLVSEIFTQDIEEQMEAGQQSEQPPQQPRSSASRALKSSSASGGQDKSARASTDERDAFLDAIGEHLLLLVPAEKQGDAAEQEILRLRQKYLKSRDWQAISSFPAPVLERGLKAMQADLAKVKPSPSPAPEEEDVPDHPPLPSSARPSASAGAEVVTAEQVTALTVYAQQHGLSEDLEETQSHYPNGFTNDAYETTKRNLEHVVAERRRQAQPQQALEV